MPTTYEHCSGCPYAWGRHLSMAERSVRDRPLSMEEHRGSDTLLVFQSPGAEEWKRGQPISSPHARSAAAKMASAFERTGKRRNDFDITNAVQCFPGKADAQVGKMPRDRFPPARVRKACSRWLAEDLHKHAYERIIVFGSVARKTVRELLGEDPRLLCVPHPTAPGVSIDSLAAALEGQPVGPLACERDRGRKTSRRKT